MCGNGGYIPVCGTLNDGILGRLLYFIASAFVWFSQPGVRTWREESYFLGYSQLVQVLQYPEGESYIL